MGTHRRVLSKSYPMNTNMTGLGEQVLVSISPCALWHQIQLLTMTFTLANGYSSEFSARAIQWIPTWQGWREQVFGQYPTLCGMTNKMMQKTWKMILTRANGYSSESTQRELSNEYQHDRVGESRFLVIISPCALWHQTVWLKMTFTLANGYSSESSQREWIPTWQGWESRFLVIISPCALWHQTIWLKMTFTLANGYSSESSQREWIPTWQGWESRFLVIISPCALWHQTKWLKMTFTLANGYSSESSQWELSNEYQHDRVGESRFLVSDISPCALWHQTNNGNGY